MSSDTSAPLFVLSGPSGAGKTTLLTGLIRKTGWRIRQSVSATTRPPRAGELNGIHYHFMEREAFERELAQGGFLEHAEVHGRFYGTLKATVLTHLMSGVDVLLDIDTIGAASIRMCADPIIQDALADVFIMPPGLDELARRLRRRGTESEEQISVRLKNAFGEMEKWRAYRYTIISGSMEEDIEKFRAVMRAERYMSCRLQLDFA